MNPDARYPRPISDSLQAIGWQPYFHNQVADQELERLVVARIGAHYGSHVLLITEAEEFSVPTSLLETNTAEGFSSLAVGDWFLISREDHRAVDHRAVDHRAVRRLDRKTLLCRKAAGETVKPQLIAANVDTVFIVSSCNQDFNLSRLERYLALVLESQAVPVVVLTKADLSDDPESLCLLAGALHPGLAVESLDARVPAQTRSLERWCESGQTVALLGSSGVGKSTLANAMGGFDQATAPIREDDAKGRHTTTARSLHRLSAGGWLIDNPGMRELQLPSCEQGVADLFDDVLQLAAECRFSNCGHQGDAGCALEAAVESGELDSRRLNSYLKLQSEQARNSASLAERRERDRKTGRMYKRVIGEKRQRRDHS